MLDDVLWRCRTLYNTALEQRITAWQRCHVSVSRYEQEAELKAIRAEFSEYAAIHSHVLQDVLARLDKTYQAFFRRVSAWREGGVPALQGPLGNRYHSFTFKEYGNGATLDNGVLVLSKIGRIGVHWSRPLAGHAQDRHHLQGGRRLVRRHLLCRGADAPTAADRPGDRDRPWAGILRHAGRWDHDP